MAGLPRYGHEQPDKVEQGWSRDASGRPMKDESGEETSRDLK